MARGYSNTHKTQQSLFHTLVFLALKEKTISFFFFCRTIDGGAPSKHHHHQQQNSSWHEPSKTRYEEMRNHGANYTGIENAHLSVVPHNNISTVSILFTLSLEKSKRLKKEEQPWILFFSGQAQGFVTEQPQTSDRKKRKFSTKCWIIPSMITESDPLVSSMTRVS